MASDLTTLTGQLAAMKQAMIDRLTAQGVTGYTMSSTMADIVTAYNQLQTLNYQTTTITENGTYVSGSQYTGYNNFVVNVPSGGSATHKKYNLFDRVREDINGDTIGTVVGFSVSNNIEYAIVCLDAQYRLASGQYLSSDVAISNLNSYAIGYNAVQQNNVETATFNCDKILEQATASGLTSTAVSHCRALSFTVAGSVYTGQLPSAAEIPFVIGCGELVNANDPTAQSNPSLIIQAQPFWTSTQQNAQRAWGTSNTGSVYIYAKTTNGFVAPILEIPNANS